jgi:methionyl-tRNA formyltransferase
MRYLFWGTPEFAAVSLEALLDAGYEPFAVVTAMDKVSGRGRKLTASPVRELALARKIPVWQPASLKDPGFVGQVRESGPDFMVVVAFRMLPQEIIEIPPGGTWNLHGSLLPDLRGAAPIHWAIRLGYRRTGLTVFRIQYQIDTGDVLAMVQVNIPENADAGMLHDAMAMEGGRLLVQVLPQIAQRKYELIPQDQVGLPGISPRNAAPKIQRSDAAIDWARDGQELVNFVRAFAPAPGAYTFLNGTRIVVLEVKFEDLMIEFNIPTQDQIILNRSNGGLTEYPAGYCLVRGKKWWIRSGNSWLQVIRIKPENSTAMTAEAYLRGHADVAGRICSKEL